MAGKAPPKNGNNRLKGKEPKSTGGESGKSKAPKKREIFEIVLFFSALFLALALIVYQPEQTAGVAGGVSATNWLGRMGASAAGWFALMTFGKWGALALPIAIFLWLVGRWSNLELKPGRWNPGLISLGYLTGHITAVVQVLSAVVVPGSTDPVGDASYTGFVPLLVVTLIKDNLNTVGTILVTLLLVFVTAVLCFNMRPTVLLYNVFVRFPLFIWNAVSGAFVRTERPASEEDDGKEDEPPLAETDDPTPKRHPRQQEEAPPVPANEPVHATRQTEENEPSRPKGTSGYKPPWMANEPDGEDTADAPPRRLPHREPVSPPDTTPAKTVGGGKKPVAVSLPSGSARSLPPFTILDEPPPDRPVVDPAELREKSKQLESKLLSLKIQAEVVKTNPGPVITRFDLIPESSVKISRIAGTSDDIAMILKAKGIRILAPIPGEAAVGIEIPNHQPQVVFIREVIDSEMFRNSKSPLIVALGKDTRGDVYTIDLARQPHLLIAGATGSGKSVCINTILSSILFRTDPKDVRFVLVDPKKIELSLYARLSQQHLLSVPGLGEDVITSPGNAVKALRSVHFEMERRYTVLAQVGVRSLDEYNRWAAKAGEYSDVDGKLPEHLPYIVVIIDELADLMMTVRREFEELVVRLAQMARAVGIHLIVATQRPSVDVVTGLIKANFPARIAFQVATRVDSRTIIDSIGAEALLGRGDMLYMGPGTASIQRLHGAFVSTEEVEQLIEFVRSQPPVDSTFALPDPEIPRLDSVTDVSVDSAGMEMGNDELFNQAAKIVTETEQGSVSLLQRRLRVGYARAARLIDELERAGVVGAFDGSKARQVLMTPEELKERMGIE